MDSVEIKWLPNTPSHYFASHYPQGAMMRNEILRTKFPEDKWREGQCVQSARYGKDTNRIPATEATRVPVKFRERVLAQFQSPENIEYLRGVFMSGSLREFEPYLNANLLGDIYEFSFRRAYEILDSDPVANRGRMRPATSMWDEVKRLNLAFIRDRIEFTQQQPGLAPGAVTRDGIAEDEESYEMRMFTADSLRPPGLEHLNNPGPAFALLEDQSSWVPGSDQRSDVAVMGAASRAVGCGDNKTFPGGAPGGQYTDYPYPAEDSPWREGNANRTPEQAILEYWGDNYVGSKTTLGSAEQAGITNGTMTAWGSHWRDKGGRYMRYKNIPFWQLGGRTGYDYDIEETLGTQARELDSNVRRWDMERLRNPRPDRDGGGRRYGARSGML
jgi:hypothetical protein